MEQQLAQGSAGGLGVHGTQVVREYWEVTFLDALLSGEHGKNLVFRGGTALRLAYRSPRFSEDLDFLLLEDSLSGKLEELASSLAQLHRDKVKCVEERAAPKDLFDLWFICQMMKVPYAPPVAVMERKTLRRDLRKFLPRKYWPMIEELA